LAWQQIETKIGTEATDKRGLTSTQKTFAAARVLYAIKNGEVTELPPLRSEGKEALEAIVKMRGVRRRINQTLSARGGKSSTPIDAEYFVGNEGAKTGGVNALVKAGWGTSKTRGYLTLNEVGKAHVEAYEASLQAEKITVDLPAKGGKFTVAPNSISVNAFLKGLGVQPSKLETRAAQLWDTNVPSWVRSGSRGDSLAGASLEAYVQQQSPAYQQAFYETAKRFRRTARGA
jgi:hypothetical protein